MDKTGDLKRSIDLGKVTSVQGEGEARLPVPFMETIEEGLEEPESRPVTRSKFPSQPRRAMLTRTPAPTTPKPPVIENIDEVQNGADTTGADIEIKQSDVVERSTSTDVLITEFREDTTLDFNEATGLEEQPDDILQVTVGTREECQSDDEDWDTDLEIEDDVVTKDMTHQSRYEILCENLGVVPISYLSRHLGDKVIVMRNHGVGPRAAKAIARTLKNIITVDELDLEGNWTEVSGGKYIAKMLEEHEYILKVNMAGNKLGSSGARHMTRMLNNNTTLKVINLSDNDFHENDAASFAEVMEENKTLKELYLSRNNFNEYSGEVLGPAIGANDNLDVLDLSWNRIRLHGALAVAKGLKATAVSKSRLNPDAKIAHSFKTSGSFKNDPAVFCPTSGMADQLSTTENVHLKVCNLSWNGFGPTGGVAIAEALQTNSSLLELDITGNRLDTNTALRLAKALLVNDTLEILKMGNNPISTTGAVAVVTAISHNENSAIKILDLSNIPVEIEFLRTAEDLQKLRALKTVYGQVLRSGNTTDDIGKPAVDPYTPRDPVILLKEHLIVNDDRLYEVLNSYDADGTFSVTPQDFVCALQELGVNENKDKLVTIVNKLSKAKDGKIYFGDHNMNSTGTPLAKPAQNK